MAVKIKQKKGKWWVFINHKGKRKAKCIGKSERAARDVAGKIEAKLKLGDLQLLEPEKPRAPLFGAYVQDWLQTCQARGLKASTLEAYEWLINKHLTIWDKKALTDISRATVRGLLVDKATAGLSRARVGLILSVVSTIFAQAVDDELIATNPASRQGSHLAKKKQRALPRFTQQELGTFMQTAKETTSDWYIFFLLLARTGLRLGEGLGLQWPDLDWHSSFVEVKRTLSRGRVTTPKSGKARQVDMSPQLAVALRDWQAKQQDRAWRLQLTEVPSWIFWGDDGRPYGEKVVRTSFNTVLVRAGLRRLTVHGLRHTYASLLIEKGKPLTYIMEQLGHHSIKITVDTYGHLIPGGNRSAVADLDDPLTTTIRKPDATYQSNNVQPAIVSTTVIDLTKGNILA